MITSRPIGKWWLHILDNVSMYVVTNFTIQFEYWEKIFYLSIYFILPNNNKNVDGY